LCAGAQEESSSKADEVQSRENEMKPKLNVRTKAESE